MNLLTSTVANFVNQIAKSAQIASLIPSSIFVLFNVIYVFPNDFVETPIFFISLIVLVIVAFSYLLWLLNTPIIKLLEGYSFYHTKLGRRMARDMRIRYRELKQYLIWSEEYLQEANRRRINAKSLHEQLQALDLKMKWEAINLHCRRELKDHFPPIYLKTHFERIEAIPLDDSKRILPTKLGNTIAAFEEYPHSRYRMDSIALWPRFVPLLEKKGFIKYVEQEKSGFDFLLNLILIVSLLGVECLILAPLFGQIDWVWGTVLALIFALIAYPVLTVSAVYWGNTFKVAFDLYRHDLREALLLRTPVSLDQEKLDWEDISRFLAENRIPENSMWDYSLLNKDRKQTGQKDKPDPQHEQIGK